MIETYLAAEREAALRPVLALAAELMDTYAVHSSALARELCHVAQRIRAACSGQGDGADGPSAHSGRPGSPRQAYGHHPGTREDGRGRMSGPEFPPITQARGVITSWLSNGAHPNDDYRDDANELLYALADAGLTIVTADPADAYQAVRF